MKVSSAPETRVRIRRDHTSQSTARNRAISWASGADLRPRDLAVLTATIGGFLFTLWLTPTLPLARPYWVPLVYLQVIATTGLANRRALIQRMVGACLGTAIVLGLTSSNLPSEVHLAIAVVAFCLALRITLAYPMVSRALTTAAIILILLATGEGTLTQRLLAESVALALLMVIAALIALFASRTENNPRQSSG